MDRMQYQIALSQLESIKGKKKPVQDFIKKLYNEHLSKIDYTAQEMMYPFLLATKAMTYDGSAKPIKGSIQTTISHISDRLLNRPDFPASKVDEIFEFYDSSAYVNVDSIKELPEIIPLLKAAKTTKLRIPTHYSFLKDMPYSLRNDIMIQALKAAGASNYALNHFNRTSTLNKSEVEKLEECTANLTLLLEATNQVIKEAKNEQTNNKST